MKTRKFILAVPMVLAATLIVVLMGATESMAATAEQDPPSGVLEIEVTNEDTYEVLISGAYFNSYQECGTNLFIPGIPGECLPGTSGAFSRPHFFPGPGVYTVTLTINGPGGFITLDESITFNQLPQCGIAATVPQPWENSVNFAADWWHGSPIGEYPYDFADDSPALVLTGTTGVARFDHDFPIILGESVTYWTGFTVYNDINPESTTCTMPVVIDYRYPPTYKTFLPFISKTPLVPACSIEITEQDLNHIEFGVNWSGAGSGTHTFDFGDGAVDQQFSGPEGTGTTWHDYSYPGGNFTAKLLLDGGGTCSIPVVVNWP